MQRCSSPFWRLILFNSSSVKINILSDFCVLNLIFWLRTDDLTRFRTMKPGLHPTFPTNIEPYQSISSSPPLQSGLSTLPHLYLLLFNMKIRTLHFPKTWINWTFWTLQITTYDYQITIEALVFHIFVKKNQEQSVISCAHFQGMSGCLLKRLISRFRLQKAPVFF